LAIFVTSQQSLEILSPNLSIFVDFFLVFCRFWGFFSSFFGSFSGGGCWAAAILSPRPPFCLLGRHFVSPQLPFARNCGADDVCVDALEVTVEFLGGGPVVLGVSRELELSLGLRNRGEDSHGASLELRHPRGFSYRKVQKDEIRCWEGSDLPGVPGPPPETLTDPPVLECPGVPCREFRCEVGEGLEPPQTLGVTLGGRLEETWGKEVETLLERLEPPNLLPPILGGSLGGLVLLALAVWGLQKVGFFKRHYKELLETPPDPPAQG
ncbi:uncharacterized protein, partial [Heliangelus exortis]|uniref:uncharacterized protein n=1 Tax=Heliangelus exortis TaxID=472823 RepID=UPI003A8D4A9E